MHSLHSDLQEREEDIPIYQEEVRIKSFVMSNSELPESYSQSDQCVIFDVGVRVENDFLIRARHFKGKS